MGDADSIVGQLLVTPSLVHGSRSDQPNKTVQFPKQLSKAPLCFLVDQVLASQIKTGEGVFINEEDSIAGQPLVTHIL